MGKNAAYRTRKTKNKRNQLSRGQPPPGQDSGAPFQAQHKTRKRKVKHRGRGNPPQSAAIQDERYKKQGIGVERAWRPSFAARLDPSLAALSQHGPLGEKEKGKEQPGLGTDTAPKTPSSRQRRRQKRREEQTQKYMDRGRIRTKWKGQKPNKDRKKTREPRRVLDKEAKRKHKRKQKQTQNAKNRRTRRILRQVQLQKRIQQQSIQSRTELQEVR